MSERSEPREVGSRGSGTHRTAAPATTHLPTLPDSTPATVDPAATHALEDS